MKFKIPVLLLFIVAIMSNGFSQELSKTEKKSLKKELKALLKDPSKYKMQKESLAQKETIVEEQTEEILSLNLENTKNKNRLDVAQDSLIFFSAKLNELENSYNQLTLTGGVDNSGMKFRLQIGKYKEFDITNFLEEKKLFTFEKDEDGTFIYTIGNFETEYDAELFKSAMRQIGVRDAFVAYYLDGVRILKE